MDNTIENCQANESQHENVILCHPDREGEAMVEIFGQVPESLLALVEDTGDGSRYVDAHPGHLATIHIGFRPVEHTHHQVKTSTEFAKDLAWRILESYNVIGEWNDTPDPDLGVAVEIALDRCYAPSEGRTIISDLRHQLRVSRTKEVSEYVDELQHQADALLDYLTTHLGFVWEWQGWDQEPRFIEKGLVRVPGTKIVLNLEGEYVISPRCRYCGEKTGWCQCSTDLEEMREKAEEKHICNECYYLQDFEDALTEYLELGKIRPDIIDEITEVMESMVPRSWDDEEPVLVEHRFESVREAADFLVHHYEGEAFEVLEWYEFIARYWKEWTERQEEDLAESGDCEGYCECPLGV